jgi:hypothetical protein|tara:strand:+ start:258 stop:464 length:207 start_codon:yes stop_codon:yes gene_type:complete
MVEDEQKRRIKITVHTDEEIKTKTMEQLYKIINFVLKFDLRDDPSGGTYSWLETAYLKLKQDDGIPLT